MSPTPSPLADRFALILGNLSRLIAARMAQRPADQAVLMLLWRYLQRRAAQFRTLAERVGSSTLPPAREPLPTPRPRAPRDRGTRLPSRIAWVAGLVPGSAVFSSQLRQLLTEPEMAALLAAAPQAGRILRPLLRMLDTSPVSQILPPPAPAANAPAGHTAPRAQPLAPPPSRSEPTWHAGHIRLGSFLLPVPA